MLIDCANYNNSSDYRTETLDYIDDYVTDGQLDYLMLTHCDSDHVYFMDEVLEEYRVSNVFMPNVLATHDEVESANIDEAKLDMFTDKDTVERPRVMPTSLSARLQSPTATYTSMWTPTRTRTPS